MAEISKEERDRYYREVSIRLRGEGLSTEKIKDGLLPVRWQGKDLCRVTAGGGAQFRETDLEPEG